MRNEWRHSVGEQQNVRHSNISLGWREDPCVEAGEIEIPMASFSIRVLYVTEGSDCASVSESRRHGPNTNVSRVLWDVTGGHGLIRHPRCDSVRSEACCEAQSRVAHWKVTCEVE